jgi:SAM-dependent methyltransferase
MRDAYEKGDNAMDAARQLNGKSENDTTTTLIAYDLQSGSYVAHASRNAVSNNQWGRQLAELIAPFIQSGDSVLEVGCGEATTLCGVLRNLAVGSVTSYGFDVSWSRCHIGNQWLRQNGQPDTHLFVADLFSIPLADNSIDVVYTSHSIEPNGGRERDAIQEIMRIARKAVVLVEPIYELASAEAQKRMLSHGYVRNLKETAESLGGRVTDCHLLDHCANPLNPSGCVVIKKDPQTRSSSPVWQCPMTGAPMSEANDLYHVKECGVVYPILRQIPMLRPEHAIIASKIS